MKLNNRYWIYYMECVPTGQIYVGQTGQPVPMWRWAEHRLALKNGYSNSPLLQKAWDQHPDLTQWRFGVLDVVEGKRLANIRECERVLELPESKRLNVRKTLLTSVERRNRVEIMLREGRRYVDIRDEVGISMGMISKIKKHIEYECSSNDALVITS